LDLEIEKPYREGNKGIGNYDELEPTIINDSIVKNKKYTEGVREFLLARNIFCQMDYLREARVIDLLFNNFKKAYPSSNYISQLQKMADKRQAILPGSVAPDLTGTSIEGNSFSLKELKGKVVYIDVWATWCGPCRKEFPYSKKLQKLFEQNKNVVFLFLSIDRDIAAWKKLVTNDKDLQGIHINQPDEQLLKSYLIKGPCYILVDQEGKIANSDAPKPSSGKVENEIRELLEKIKS